MILQSGSRYTAESPFLSLHGHDFIIMPNDAVDGISKVSLVQH